MAPPHFRRWGSINLRARHRRKRRLHPRKTKRLSSNTKIFTKMTLPTLNRMHSAIDEGTYQHNRIQAELLRRWKLRTNQPLNDGYYNIRLDSKGNKNGTGEPCTMIQTIVAFMRKYKLVGLILLVFFLQLAKTNFICNSACPQASESDNAGLGDSPVLDLPTSVRAADRDAFDRIAMMLPSRWMDWLIDPPFISAAWPEYPSQSMRDVHQSLIHLIRSSPWRNVGSERLLDPMRHAIGTEQENEVYPSDSSPGWLRDAADCLNTVPVFSYIYCRMRYPSVIPDSQQKLLMPMETYVANELVFLNDADLLFSQFELLASHQQLETLSAVEIAIQNTARSSFPIVQGLREHSMSNLDQLTSHYGYFTQAVFFDLLSVTLLPEINDRIQRLESFQDVLLQQRQSLASAGHSAVPIFHRAVRDWIAQDAAYALRSNTFGNGTQMRNTACKWTLERMPIQEYRSHPLQSSPTEHGTSILERIVQAFCGCEKSSLEDFEHRTTRIHNSRIRKHNALAYFLWLSTSGPESVRWHWEEGGSFALDWEKKIAADWKQYIQCRTSIIIAGAEGLEEKGEALTALPSRRDQANLQWSWPRLTERKECKALHARQRLDRDASGNGLSHADP